MILFVNLVCVYKIREEKFGGCRSISWLGQKVKNHRH